jgi:hypothetical protein
MSVVVLGWGSLIWNSGKLPLRGGWEQNGPTLPIEFSRISRDGRLTLIIDDENGATVPTRFAKSPRTELQDAIDDLWDREGKPLKASIGFLDRSSGAGRARLPAVRQAINAWATERDFEAVIWTDLSSNFREKEKQEYSPEAAGTYLERLRISSPKVFEKAVEYIANAAPEVDTAARRYFTTAHLIRT